MLRVIEVLAGYAAAVGGVVYLTGLAGGTWQANREWRKGGDDA